MCFGLLLLLQLAALKGNVTALRASAVEEVLLILKKQAWLSGVLRTQWGMCKIQKTAVAL